MSDPRQRAIEETADHMHRRDLRAGRLPDVRTRALSEAGRLVETLEAQGLRIVDAAALTAVLDHLEWRVPESSVGDDGQTALAMVGCSWCDSVAEGDYDAAIPHSAVCPVRTLRAQDTNPPQGSVAGGQLGAESQPGGAITAALDAAEKGEG